ncbi:uncharacterized protein CC84DRAFT_187536 [Paraphaeosphaeria sporulosa]|uniref:Uncharacterized protein n=1 Tax=Paraphaeosphaeria sporulosa TaxID=1460663 RepID=A0A177C131_9PLEO|nr:uncharacterized protein CC84DRAFT_187536 [Paraphaeosphaeria sporulosa]OAG01343.1 hypothetical protein CC84DRAFT_187536 [Paraphaeosphaeria sporulosa]
MIPGVSTCISSAPILSMFASGMVVIVALQYAPDKVTIVEEPELWILCKDTLHDNGIMRLIHVVVVISERIYNGSRSFTRQG